MALHVTRTPGDFLLSGLQADGTSSRLATWREPEEGEILIGELDLYGGQKVFTQLLIEGQGSTWTIEVMPISSAGVFTGSAAASGDRVMIYDGPAMDVLCEHRGEWWFALTSHGPPGQFSRGHFDPLASGDITVSTTLPSGLSVLTVGSTYTSWSIHSR